MSSRTQGNDPRKRLLGLAAAQLVGRSQLLLMDAGSTNLAIAQQLPRDMDLTVATNAPDLAAHLLREGGIRVLMIGGLANAHSGACLGARALRDLRSVRADLAFLGACAVDVEIGVTGFDLEEAEFKAAMAEQSRAIAVAVTTEKLDSAAFYHIVAMEKIRHLVVEADIEDRRLEPYRAAGVQIQRAALPHSCAD